MPRKPEQQTALSSLKSSMVHSHGISFCLGTDQHQWFTRAPYSSPPLTRLQGLTESQNPLTIAA